MAQSSQEEEEEVDVKYKFTNELLYSDKITSFVNQFIPSIFLGCFPRDMVPIYEIKQKEYVCCIVNLDTASESGSHFVALVRYGNTLFLYDSIPSDAHMALLFPVLTELLCAGTALEILWSNHTQHQSIASNACGYFCIWFLLEFYIHSPTLRTIDSLFRHLKDDDYMWNEQVIIKDLLEAIRLKTRNIEEVLTKCICGE